ncbi:MAG: hypothetical protein QM796_00345 [Chthoniobacteraceae bacterium]
MVGTMRIVPSQTLAPPTIAQSTWKSIARRSTEATRARPTSASSGLGSVSQVTAMERAPHVTSPLVGSVSTITALARRPIGTQ